ncbi:hypothetical protein G5714_000180 [Onychostoma macrolepis]|uniref:Uncharacterized protein n=1 Tax=Onychostoma macrolepis TaxID=369639 RepID=A0A7J6DFV6_9TELE|nr:hypothetical protein G5714_000180 [Onychostoma macrolepis]
MAWQRLRKVNFEQYDGLITFYGREDLVSTKWKPGTIQHSFQEDGSSCGVFVMLMAKPVVEGFPKIPDSINIRR